MAIMPQWGKDGNTPRFSPTALLEHGAEEQTTDIINHLKKEKKMKKLNLFEPLIGFSKANLYFNLWNRAIYFYPDRIERIKNELAKYKEWQILEKIKFLADICKMKSLPFEFIKNENMLACDDKQFFKIRRCF